MSKTQIIDVTAVDQFLQCKKTLVGGPPEWRIAKRSWEYTAQWIVADDLGIQSGKIRFKLPRDSYASESVVLIFREMAIWRIDLASISDCEPNPPDAAALNLQPSVCGPHEHTWLDNRQVVIDTNKPTLPYRRPLAPNLKRLGQILPYLCRQTNITLAWDQHGFDSPPQHELLRARPEDE
jgi:hypothetical protein